MMYDGLTKQLFGSYPRVVGDKRKLIVDMDGMEKYLLEKEGSEDCYVSVYNKDLVIDKILFDFDHIDGKPALEDGKKVYSWLVANGFTAVAIASGKKGVHIYCLLSPTISLKDTSKQDIKTILKQTQNGILKAVFGEGKKTTADPHIIGDVERIIRIPNTRRPITKLWCVPLPSDFVNWRWGDVVWWTKQPHEFPVVSAPTKTINDLPKTEGDRSEIIEDAVAEKRQPQSESDTQIILKATLRPCLYNACQASHPEHTPRLAIVAELHSWGYSAQDICEMLETLNWTEWEHNVAFLQIVSCIHLNPYKCDTLRGEGLCLYKNIRECPYGR